MTFKRFVADQVERLSAFEVFARLPEAGKKEFVEFLNSKANEPNPSRDRTKLDWRDSIAANQVVSVINECLDFADVPSLSDVRAVWNRLFPPVLELRKDCDRCNGSGFVQVDGPFGLGCAYVCSHQPETEADRRKGLGITPAMSKRLIAEQQESDRRRVEFLKRRAEGKLNGFHRVTQEDVNALMGDLGIDSEVSR